MIIDVKPTPTCPGLAKLAITAIDSPNPATTVLIVRFLDDQDVEITNSSIEVQVLTQETGSAFTRAGSGGYSQLFQVTL